MSKAVMISIQPKYCELIASGKKTIEVRKTAPKLQTPFKVYIYQTKKKWIYRLLKKLGLYQGKVIGEFVCDRIDEFLVFENKTVQYWNYHNLEKSCLTYDEIANYIGTNKKGYGLHIFDLKIYDKPKELWEFSYPCTGKKCSKCQYEIREDLAFGEVGVGCGRNHITHPPQSWGYVEEMQE